MKTYIFLKKLSFYYQDAPNAQNVKVSIQKKLFTCINISGYIVNFYFSK